MKAQLVKPVKYDLSYRSSVFTPVSPISKTEILSGKYPVKFYRISEFYQIPDTGIRIRYIPTKFRAVQNLAITVIQAININQLIAII